MSEDDEQEMTDEDYKIRRMQYSHNDQVSWEEEGKSEDEIRKFVEFEETLTYEEKDKAREERQNVREVKEFRARLDWIGRPDEEKSEKDILIEIKDKLDLKDLGYLHHLPEIRTNTNFIREYTLFITILLVIIALILVIIAFII